MKDLMVLEGVEKKIYLIRSKRVMLDYDLAFLYGVENKQLKRQVRRSKDRFPPDFMFQLTKEEYRSLRRQIGTFKKGEHSKYLPFAFTEHGALMLSSVLNSKKACEMGVFIVRAFVRMREILGAHKDLIEKINKMESKYDYQFKAVFDAIRALIDKPVKKIGKIGFVN